MQRQRNDPREHRLSDRIVAGADTEGLLEVRVQVDRDVVDRGADAALPQRLDELPAVDPQPIEVEADRIQVPRRFDLAAHRRADHFGQRRQQLVVMADDRLPPRLERLDAGELVDAERALDVGHRVVEAGRQHLVRP